jgi:glycosyltransferase involved in cell wall biosynthesis
MSVGHIQRHVLVLADGLFPFVVGGMQRHSAYVVRFLLQKGYRVTLAHFVGQGSPVPGRGEVIKALGVDADVPFNHLCIRFPSMGLMPGHYLKESYACSKMFFDQVKRDLNTIDFIYAKGFTGWYFVEQRIKGKYSVPPVGVKFHGYEMFQQHVGWKGWIEKQMLRSPVKWITQHADVVFSYGGGITEIIRSIGVPDERIAEVPSGIEQAWCVGEVPPRSGPVRFLFLGRFERRKGVRDLHDALRRLNPDGRWLIEFAGPIPVSERFVSPYVTYHGAVTEKSELTKIMDRCDVLIVPSYAEGMPNVILEGMARGLAIAATDVGAVNCLTSNENGWLIPSPGMENVLSTLQEVVSTPREQIIQKQRNSLVRVKQSFLWEQIAEVLDQKINSHITGES